MQNRNENTPNQDPYSAGDEALRQYLLTDRGANPENILVLPSLPGMIGGLEYRGSFTLPDAKDVDKWNADLSTEMRIDAIDTPEAIKHVMEAIKSARASGRQIGTLLVPGGTASNINYVHRLHRLAQETGIRVIIKRSGDPELPDDYLKIDPPQISSIKEYWDARATASSANKPRPPYVPQGNEGLDALMLVTSQPELWSWDSNKTIESILAVAAASAPGQLRSWLTASGAPAKNVLYNLHLLAFDEQNTDYSNRCLARKILAKAGHPAASETLLSEIRSSDRPCDENLVTKPLGLCIQENQQLCRKIIERIEQLLTNPKNQELPSLLGSLCHSQSPHAALYLLSLLDYATDDRDYTVNVIEPIVRRLPLLISSIRDLPDSEIRQRVLNTAEKQAHMLLVNSLPDTGGSLAGSPYVDPGSLAKILFESRKAEYEEVLRRYMHNLYARLGYLITHPKFESEYIEFRKIYGDLTELQPRFATQNTQKKPENPSTSPESAPSLQEALADLKEHMELLKIGLDELAANLKHLVERLRDQAE